MQSEALQCNVQNLYFLLIKWLRRLKDGSMVNGMLPDEKNGVF